MGGRGGTGGIGPPGAHGLRGIHGPQASMLALVIAVAIHVLVGVAVLRVDGNWRRTAEAAVEIEVNAPPPPPEIRPEPMRPTDSPASPVVARAIPRRTPAPQRPSPPAAPTPPPPNQQPPPQAAVRNAPPVFGVTMSSVVSGEAAMAVPVGNTTMTQNRESPAHRVAEPYAPDGSKPFVPAPEMDAASLPHVLREVASDDVYPPEARNLGIEGTVELGVDIDEKGHVVQVRVLRRGGHKFDEAAVEAMKQFLYTPARARDGHPIPYRISYKFIFTMKN